MSESKDDVLTAEIGWRDYLLPPLHPQEPFVMDLRLGQDHKLEVEWASLDPA